MTTIWPNKQCNLTSTTWLLKKNFWQVVANKKSLLTQNLTLHEFKFSIKKVYFLKLENYMPGYYKGNMLLAVSKDECVKNQMRLVPNTSIWSFLNHLQFINVCKIKGMGIIWHSILYIYLLIL